MAKDPAFLFYYKDWLATTRFMKPEDKGYFVDLLCYQAEMGTVSQEIIDQMMPSENWQKLKPKFTRNRHGFYNDMQRMFLDKRRKYVDSRRNNGKKGGRPKKHKDNHMDNLVNNLPENETVNEKVIEELLNNELKDDSGFDWNTGKQQGDGK